MGYVNKKNKIGSVGPTGPLLAEGELGLDLNAAYNDVGRLWVGTGTENIALAKLSEVAGYSQAQIDALLLLKEDVINKGAPNGYAGLDASGLVPSSQLPSYVDDVLEFANVASFPVIGEREKIYVDLSTNRTHRWSGSIYVEVADGQAAWGTITGILSDQLDLQAVLTRVELVTDTTTLHRYDKILANKEVALVVYTGGDVSEVRYSGDNGTTIFYRDVLVYTTGHLTEIKHYCGTIDLVTPSAVTTLVYAGTGELLSTQYMEN